ncbi:uncharacterized protein ARMOST_01337 [Armillaria ostoyae]|uniref:Uncharacterized protein n=1 Tax=Armillaria ostoyae TaxID=47428 RepID=A0A284QNV5_ARMOS|nr:uncharacterized protein ARMOST_01337 [Armillaria ostoyae]
MDYDKPWPKSQGVRMAHLALYVLAKVEETGVWNAWPTSTYRQPSLNNSAKFNSIIPTLLNCTIRESLERFDCWGMAQVFWNHFSSCHHGASSLALQLYNSDSEDTVSENLIDIFFAAYEDSTLELSSITQMADEVFTHLCVPFMNPGETRSGTETPATIPEDAEAAATELLAEYDSSDPWGRRRLAVLKSLVFLRDGGLCPLTECAFIEFASKPSLLLAPATLRHVVPNSIGSNNKTEPLRMISLFAGKEAAEVVRKELNSLGNVINLYPSGSMIFEELTFGIEALEEDDEMHYYFRLPPNIQPPEPGTSPIFVKPNARLAFGVGPHGKMLGGGPNPDICNLHWAIVKVMNMSGASQNFREQQRGDPPAMLPVHYINARLDKIAMERGTVSAS